MDQDEIRQNLFVKDLLDLDAERKLTAIVVHQALCTFPQLKFDNLSAMTRVVKSNVRKIVNSISSSIQLPIVRVKL